MAGGLKSSTYKLHAIDLPAVKNIKVTYEFPPWTGMKSVTRRSWRGSGARSKVQSHAKIEIQTDRALSNGSVLFEGTGSRSRSTPQWDNKTTEAGITIEKDGTYHIGVMDHGEMVRLTDDYFIEARKVGAPTVRITKPGKDAKVSPIEEVDIQVTAEDDYPLQDLDIHYSVNGAPEKTVAPAKAERREEVEGHAMLSMEEFVGPRRISSTSTPPRKMARTPQRRTCSSSRYSVRVQLYAVPGWWRGRRWWRNGTGAARFPSAKRKSSLPPSTRSRAIRKTKHVGRQRKTSFRCPAKLRDQATSTTAPKARHLSPERCCLPAVRERNGSLRSGYGLRHRSLERPGTSGRTYA